MMKRIIESLCFFSALLGLVSSCRNEAVHLEVEDEIYRAHLRYRDHNHLEVANDGEVVYLNFTSDRLYPKATGHLLEYYVGFEVFVRDSDFSDDTATVQISDFFSEEDWYKSDPKSYGQLQESKAALWVTRAWSNDPVAKAFPYNQEWKDYFAIDGWIKVIKRYTNAEGNTVYGAEFLCTAVAYEDGDVLVIQGDYNLQ